MTEKEKRFAEIYGSKEGINQLVQGDEAERKRITDEFKRTYPGIERMARRRDNALKQMIQADNFMNQSPMTEEDAIEMAKSMQEIRDKLVAQGVNAVLVPDYSYLELKVFAQLAKEGAKINPLSSDVTNNTVDDRKEGESESKRQVEDGKGAKENI